MDTFETLGGCSSAIDKLYEGCPFARADVPCFENPGGRIFTSQVLLMEGIDFDLTFFPFEHLGYKAVLQAVGALFASLAKPSQISVTMGVSAKLDYPEISRIWKGVVKAAGDFGSAALALDLRPSLTGLTISVCASGSSPLDTGCPEPASMDLVCVSNSLGASFLGEQILRKSAELPAKERDTKLSAYRQLVGAYLKPELQPRIPEQLSESGIRPSLGVFCQGSLRDSILKISRYSGLGVKIYVDRIPLAGGTVDCAKELGLDPLQAALRGGDDNCLLFVIPLSCHDAFRHDFQTWDIIGHLARKEAGTVLVSPDGLEHEI